MNSALSSLFWVALAAGALALGIHYQKDREIETLQQEYQSIAARQLASQKEVAVLKAKLEQARGEAASGSDFEAQHNASSANIAAEQKKIDALLNQWPAIDADRAALIDAVRQKETTRPPYTLTLLDGARLENFVYRSAPNEATISAQHTSGLTKIPAANLPEDLKKRLGLGWKPQPPASITIDKEGNAVVKQAIRLADEKAAKNATAEELGIAPPDLSSIEGISRALAIAEARLAKANANFEAEKANMRKLAMFKQHLLEPSSNKTYGTLGKESQQRIAALAGSVTALRAEANNLKHKLKLF
jgi:hypothetical protein